jgi:uncharacterized protein YlxW (UPF0749 family)
MDWEKLGTALAALTIGAGAIAARVRRNTSKENVAAAKDAAETRLISRLQEERDHAQAEAHDARERAAAVIAHVARLEAQNTYLKSYARRLLRAMPPKERVIYETDFSPFIDQPEEPPP